MTPDYLALAGVSHLGVKKEALPPLAAVVEMAALGEQLEAVQIFLGYAACLYAMAAAESERLKMSDPHARKLKLKTTTMLVLVLAL